MEELLWNLARFIQEVPPEKMNNDLLAVLYSSVGELRKNMSEIGISTAMIQVVDRIYQQLSSEVKRRDLHIKAFYVLFDDKGNIAYGRNKLKQRWSEMSFDGMMNFLDSMLEGKLTDAQRQSLIELADEVVMEKNQEWGEVSLN